MPAFLEKKLKAEYGDWCWLAGIFEGEGCAILRWAKKRHLGSARRAYLYVSISQRETTMLSEVKRIAGLGQIYPGNRADNSQIYSWYCACLQARIFLNKLLPLIRSAHKKLQVEQALAMDAEMRMEGTRVRRATLKRNSEERWRKYHAEVSRRKTEEGIRVQ